MESKRQRVIAVVGAGMAGLAAAHKLAKEGLEVTVFEKNSYVGGRVKTDVYNGQHIEGGAQVYFEFCALTRKLIHELDLAEFETYLPSRSGILRSRGIAEVGLRPALLLDGHLGLRSKLLLGKLLRLLLAHWSQLDYAGLDEAQHLDTRSVAEYAVQELNQEILEYVFEPVLSGLFYWPSKEISQAALFVLLRQALFGLRPMTLTCGLSSLPCAIAEEIDVRVNHTVTKISRTESGKYTVAARNDCHTSKLQFDAVVCATTATAIPKLIPWLNSTQRKFFQSIKYSQNVNVPVEVEINPIPEMCSLYIPLVEAHIQNLGAVTQQSRSVISLFSSAKSGVNLIGETDMEISTKLVQDLEKALLAANDSALRPISQLIYRWPRALPILDVGYFDRLRAFQSGKIESGRLVFCGDYLGGPFIEGAVRSGVDAANRLTSLL